MISAFTIFNIENINICFLWAFGRLSSNLLFTCSSLGRGHCVFVLGKTVYFHSASLHPGVLNFSGDIIIRGKWGGGGGGGAGPCVGLASYPSGE